MQHGARHEAAFVAAQEANQIRDLLLAGECLADDIGIRAVCEDEIIERARGMSKPNLIRRVGSPSSGNTRNALLVW